MCTCVDALRVIARGGARCRHECCIYTAALALASGLHGTVGHQHAAVDGSGHFVFKPACSNYTMADEAGAEFYYLMRVMLFIYILHVMLFLFVYSFAQA